MKDIQQYFDYLFRLERTGMKYDLTNITYILNKLDNPHKKFKSIHIAGTNGKGATASFVASILMEHGLRTGLFTSPHIIRFNERIRVNGKCINDKYIKSFLEENKELIEKIRPSFFEVNTAMAFKYFADKKVDIAVVECGLGGSLDSTNVLKPELCIITQIGMDHMQYLGNTLRKIALEKIGIVKPAIDVIVSDDNRSLKQLFRTNIEKQHLFYLDKGSDIKILKNNLDESRFTLENETYQVPLAGKFQIRNAAAAVIASKKYLIKEKITPKVKKINSGLKNVKINSGYRCRLETFKKSGIEYIFDISHNTEGLRETAKVLKSKKPDVIVFGIMEDKDLHAAIRELLHISDNIVFTKANYKRAAEPEHLLRIAKKYMTRNHSILTKRSVGEAVVYMETNKNKFRKVLILGSFFVVSDAIKALKIGNKFM